VGDFAIPLKGITGAYGFELYTGKYWRVKPTSIQEARFSQDPNQTTLAQLQKLRNLMEDRRHKAVVVIEDYLGDEIRTSEFELKDQPDDN